MRRGSTGQTHRISGARTIQGLPLPGGERVTTGVTEDVPSNPQVTVYLSVEAYLTEG